MPFFNSEKILNLATGSGGAARLEMGRNGPTSAKITPNFYQKARSAYLVL
jgi:hypothetical protein